MNGYWDVPRSRGTLPFVAAWIVVVGACVSPSGASPLKPLDSALHVLPPVGVALKDAGASDETLLAFLKVTVCEVRSGGDCIVVAEFTAQGTSDPGHDTLKLLDHHYSVNWDAPKAFKKAEYEIHVAVANLEVGFVGYSPMKKGTVPIKFRIDDHPRIRARVLHEQGLCMVIIARAIQEEFDLELDDLATVLHDEFLGSFPDRDLKVWIARALRLVGGAAPQVYEILKDLFDINDPTEAQIKELQDVLLEAGFTEEEVFYAVLADRLARYHVTIRKYAPVLFLHPAEKYSLSSVDWFMDRAPLVAIDQGSGIDAILTCFEPGEFPPADLMEVVQTTREVFPDEDVAFRFFLEDEARCLYPECNNETRYPSIEVPGPCQDPDVPDPTVMGPRAGNLAGARCYVRVLTGETVAGELYTDYHFWYFYPYNGPGTTAVDAYLKIIANRWHYSDGHDEGWVTGDYGNACPFGVHTGDWEAVILRFDDSGALVKAFLSQHGEYKEILPAELEEENQHVVAYSSLNGHANFPKSGRNTHLEKHQKPIEDLIENEIGKGGDSIPILGDSDVTLDVVTFNYTARGTRFDSMNAYDILAVDKHILKPLPTPPPPDIQIPPLVSALRLLPPLGDSPTTPTKSFDETLLDHLVVSVYRTDHPGSPTLLREFTSQSEGSRMEAIQLQNHHYHVNWHSDEGSGQGPYEIRFLAAGLLLDAVRCSLNEAETLPIKFQVDNHPWIRFRLLEERGWSFEDIARALQAEFGLTHVDLAWILEAEGHSPTETAVLLRSLGYNARETYEALKFIFHVSPVDAVSILIAAGFTDTQAWSAVALDLLVDGSWIEFDGRWGWNFDLNLSNAEKNYIVKRIFRKGFDDLYDDLWEISSVVTAATCGTICAIRAIPCLLAYPSCFASCFGICFPVTNGLCISIAYSVYDYVIDALGPTIVDGAYPDQSVGGPSSPGSKLWIWWYFDHPNERINDSIAGLLAIETPENGAQVSGITPVEVALSPELEALAAKVELLIDGVAVDVTTGTLAGSGDYYAHRYDWVTTDYEDGIHTLHARMVDLNGKTWEYTWDILNIHVANTSVFVKDLVLDDDDIDEGEGVLLTVRFSSPYADEHLAVIDWGDSVQDAIPVPPGAREAVVSHQYLDDPLGSTGNAFTVQAAIVNAQGQSAPAAITVNVRNLPPEITDIAAVNELSQILTPVLFGATFTDEGILDTHTARWEWGDGTQTDQSDVSSPVGASHEYTDPGVYSVKVTITDDDGAKVKSEARQVTVYAPSQGDYAAGSGRILVWVRDPGCSFADPCDPQPHECETQEEAAFFFVYDSSVFQITFTVGGLRFDADALTSHTITDTRAAFEGTGTINDQLTPGGQPYPFRIVVVQGQGTDPDTFEITIRVPNEENEGSAIVSESDTRALLLALVHSAPVTSAVFSPDDQRVATASRDSVARIWENDTGGPCGTAVHDPLLALLHAGPVNSVAFSTDSLLLVTASDDETVRLWDPLTGDELLRFSGHAGPVHSAVFSGQGVLRIATAGDDGTARIWDPIVGAEQVRLTGHAGPIYAAAFSPDAVQIVTAGDDGTARIWDAETGLELLVLSGHVGPVRSAAFSPNGLRVVTAGDDGTGRIWDGVTGDEVLQLIGHTGSVRSCAFSPDGKQIVTAGEDGTVRVWDAENGKEESDLSVDYRVGIAQAAWNADGSLLVAALLANPQGGFETDPDQPLLGGEVLVHKKVSGALHKKIPGSGFFFTSRRNGTPTE